MTEPSAEPQPVPRSNGWRRLITPATRIEDLSERRGAQLVALVTSVLFLLTSGAALSMYALDRPLFSARVPMIAAVLGSHLLTYSLVHTRLHRLAAVLLCLGPVWSDLAVGLQSPEDPLWFAFIPAGALMASILLSFRAAVVIGALGAAATTLVVVVHRESLGGGRVAMLVGFVAIFTAIILATARFKSWVEASRRSQLLHLERQLAATQRMEAVGRLAASVSHDFNNFLTVIQGNVELVRMGRTESLEEIAKAAERAAALTEQLLAFARQQPRKPTVLLLDDVIYNLESILARLIGGKVRLVLELEARWPIEADPVQLEQVLVNLAANARDAMPEGGVLTIATRHETWSDASRADLVPGDYVLLTVTDTGVGMEPATLEHAFEPFFTTKRGKGSGLGLATVRGIVDQNGGAIQVQSQPGAGTTFRIFFPRAQPESAARSPAQVSRVPATTRA
jgi:signal transduction histidine kinase